MNHTVTNTTPNTIQIARSATRCGHTRGSTGLIGQMGPTGPIVGLLHDITPDILNGTAPLEEREYGDRPEVIGSVKMDYQLQPAPNALNNFGAYAQTTVPPPWGPLSTNEQNKVNYEQLQSETCGLGGGVPPTSLMGYGLSGNISGIMGSGGPNPPVLTAPVNTNLRVVEGFGDEDGILGPVRSFVESLKHNYNVYTKVGEWSGAILVGLGILVITFLVLGLSIRQPKSKLSNKGISNIFIGLAILGGVGAYYVYEINRDVNRNLQLFTL